VLGRMVWWIEVFLCPREAIPAHWDSSMGARPEHEFKIICSPSHKLRIHSHSPICSKAVTYSASVTQQYCTASHFPSSTSTEKAMLTSCSVVGLYLLLTKLELSHHIYVHMLYIYIYIVNINSLVENFPLVL
jgi:hypothetical protein